MSASGSNWPQPGDDQSEMGKGGCAALDGGESGVAPTVTGPPDDALATVHGPMTRMAGEGQRAQTEPGEDQWSVSHWCYRNQTRVENERWASQRPLPTRASAGGDSPAGRHGQMARIVRSQRRGGPVKRLDGADVQATGSKKDGQSPVERAGTKGSSSCDEATRPDPDSEENSSTLLALRRHFRCWR
ncbi:MAG: hypothetical protein Q9159_002170 [Coniocarpon cinnabarinum]